MRLLVITIGFDERLPLRGLLKIGLFSNDVVLLVYSKTGGEFEVRKVEKAVEVLKDIVLKAGAEVADLVVSGSNFYGDVATILDVLRRYNASEVIAILAGGMRILVFEVLAALLLKYSLVGTRSMVYVAREDGLYDVILPVDMFYKKLSKRENVVLKKLLELGEVKRNLLVDKVSREHELSESMVYKIVKNLVRKGLVRVDDDTVRLTELGQLVLEAVTS